MRFTLRCVQCMAASVLRDQQYMFGVRSLLTAEKALLIRNDLAGMLLRRPMPRLPQLMLSYGPMGQMFEQTGRYGMLKNETLTFNIYRGNINLLSLLIFSRSYAVYHL